MATSSLSSCMHDVLCKNAPVTSQPTKPWNLCNLTPSDLQVQLLPAFPPAPATLLSSSPSPSCFWGLFLFLGDSVLTCSPGCPWTCFLSASGCWALGRQLDSTLASVLHVAPWMILTHLWIMDAFYCLEHFSSISFIPLLCSGLFSKRDHTPVYLALSFLKYYIMYLFVQFLFWYFCFSSTRMYNLQWQAHFSVVFPAVSIELKTLLGRVNAWSIFVERINEWVS